MAEFYKHYGFATNPFRKRFDPDHPDNLSDQAAKRGLLLDIDGFSAFQEVEDYLQARIAEDEPAFVLVTADTGKAGLTAAACAILLKYRELVGLTNTRFGAVQVENQNHNPVDLYRSWLTALYAELKGKVGFDKNTEDSLRSGVKSDASTDELGYVIKAVMSDVKPALKGKPPAGFGSILESIRDLSPIRVAQIAFSRMNTVCVFTAPASVVNPTDVTDKHNDVHVFRLGPLKEPDVVRVVETCWNNKTPVPFNVSWFGTFCERRSHPVGTVLNYAEDLLRNRVKAYPDAGKKGPWEKDDLGYKGTQLDLFTHLESINYGKGYQSGG